MTDVTFVLIRIFLKILWFDRVAECVSDLPDLAEPDFLIVLVVVGREILLDDRLYIAGGFLWEVVFNLKQIVEEIADEFKYLFCIYYISDLSVLQCDLFMLLYRYKEKSISHSQYSHSNSHTPD